MSFKGRSTQSKKKTFRDPLASRWGGHSIGIPQEFYGESLSEGRKKVVSGHWHGASEPSGHPSLAARNGAGYNTRSVPGGRLGYQRVLLHVNAAPTTFFPLDLRTCASASLAMYRCALGKSFTNKKRKRKIRYRESLELKAQNQKSKEKRYARTKLPGHRRPGERKKILPTGKNFSSDHWYGDKPWELTLESPPALYRGRGWLAPSVCCLSFCFWVF